ncbi:glycosyltransferase [bacterium]|nr:glycosyltransferase [bacterium]
MKPLNILIFGEPYFFNDAEYFNIRIVTARMETDDEIRRGPVAGDIILPAGLHRAQDILQMAKRAGFYPDFVFFGDESRMLWVYGMEELEIPTIMYAVDTHIHRDWHIPFSAAFDYILAAQYWYLDMFKYNISGRILEYLPLFAPSAPSRFSETRDIPVVFVGTLDMVVTSRRAEFFKALEREVPVKFVYGKYAPYYSQAKIVINHASHNEINFRVFEAMYCGAMLITDRVPHLEELFTNGRHLILFESWNVSDAAEKIKYYLADEKNRARIAWDGQRTVLGNHLSIDRMRQAMKNLSPYKLGAIAKCRLEKLREVKNEVRKAYLHYENAVNLPPETREFFGKLGRGEIV